MEVEGYQQTPESIPMKMEYGKELILYGPYLYLSWILVDDTNSIIKLQCRLPIDGSSVVKIEIK